MQIMKIDFRDYGLFMVDYIPFWVYNIICINFLSQRGLFMRSCLKKISILAILAAIILLLTACSVNVDVVSTTLTIHSENFSGSRAMSFSAPINSSQTAEVTKMLRESCPAAMTMTDSIDGNSAIYTFTITFTSIEDYITKVSSVIGRAATVDFAPPSDQLFTGGFTLRENFSTTDLFAWAAAVAETKKIRMVPKSGSTKTAIILDGVSYLTDTSPINFKEEFAPLDNVSIFTDIYGSDDFVRTVYVHVSQKNLDLLGKETLEKEFFALKTENIPRNLIISAGFMEPDNTHEKTAYVFKSDHCTKDELDKFTNAIFPGSSFSIEESDAEPFSVSHKISETISLTGFVCNKDNTTNGDLVYNAMESDTINEGEKIYEIPFTNASTASAELVSHSVYALGAVDISLDVSLIDKVTFGLAVDYQDISTSKSAAELGRSYFAENWTDMDVNVISSFASVSDGDSDAMGSSQLVLTVSGTPEEVSQILASRLGEKNGIQITGRSTFALWGSSDVTQSADITEFCKMSGYTGEVGYSFTSKGGRVKGVQLTSNGGTEYDLLDGETRIGGFHYSGIQSHSFDISYVNQKINFIFLLTVLLGGTGLIFLIGAGSRLAIRGTKGKKQAACDEITLAAVTSVALANLPSGQSSISALPSELSSRQVVVLQPRQDDGLDEDGDEPENTWLLSAALKMMSILCFILFFVNFASISINDWRTPFSKVPLLNIFISPEEGLTGYKIAGGAEIYGASMPGWPMAYCLAIAPILILIILSLRRKLPRLAAAIASLAISVSQIFLLMAMPAVLSQHIEIVKQAAKSYVTDPILGMGYNYSMVVYILLTIGTLIMLISELLERVKKKG